jgi:hypothetical protein
MAPAAPVRLPQVEIRFLDQHGNVLGRRFYDGIHTYMDHVAVDHEGSWVVIARRRFLNGWVVWRLENAGPATGSLVARIVVGC